MSDEANETRKRWAKMFQTPEVSAAQYWEAQAAMWHENYKGLMAIEEEHRRFKAALRKIADANYNGARAKLIAQDALDGEREP